MAYICNSCPIKDNKAYSGICDMCKPHLDQFEKINTEFNEIMSWLKNIDNSSQLEYTIDNE